jgi:hypothetical protein
MATKSTRSKKSNQKKSKRRLKVSRTSRTRKNKMRGGSHTIFPATFSNSDVAVSPQSYLPFNKFENDPVYSSVASRNTGPFLTGVSSRGCGGGVKRRRKTMRGGSGSEFSSIISNATNTISNNIGIIPPPALNELSGVSGVMSGFSNTSSAYSPIPAKIAPLA